MKNKTRVFLAVVMAAVMLWSTSFSVYAGAAETGISPRLDNCYGASMSFAVIDPGVADFSVSYEGNPTTFVHAKLTVTFEKRILGVIWRTVDIGTTNNEWVAFSGELQDIFYDFVTMDGAGTYRANFKLEILGIDGSIDVIEKSIDCRYSG